MASSVCISASSEVEWVSLDLRQAPAHPTHSQGCQEPTNPGWRFHGLCGQPVSGSGQHPKDQICIFLPQSSIPFANCAPIPCQLEPPRKVLLLVLLAQASFSTCILSHPWHEGLHFPLSDFLRLPSVHFFSCHLLKVSYSFCTGTSQQRSCRETGMQHERPIFHR